MSNFNPLESKVKRFPFLGNSPNLIDLFLIIGYEPSYIKHKILHPIITKTIPTSNIIFSSTSEQSLFFCPKEYPVLLSSIISNYSGEMIEEDEIIKFSFPNPPSILITNSNKEELNTKHIVFYINNDSFKGGLKKMMHGFTFIFYELIYPTDSKEYKILIPKAFSFLSQYPFFKTFKTLANQIWKLFINPKGIEIPLEILLYNIINFIPSPISSSLNIQFLPNKNISTYLQSIYISKEQKRNLQKEFHQNILTLDSIQLDNEQYTTLQLLKSLQDSSIPKCKLNQLNVYPYYDYNLIEIFNILSLSSLIRLFILTFLDQEILIFSNNMEILNLTLYIITSLNYPFTDSMYFWHIISLHKEALYKRGNNASHYVGKFFTSIIGFNCKYDSNIKTTIHYKRPHFVIDLDEDEIYYKKGNDCSFGEKDEELKDLTEYQAMNILLQYIQDIFDCKKGKECFIEKTISDLEYKLQMLIEKDVSKKNDNKGGMFFKKEMGEGVQNKIMQEAFYEFILDILNVVYEGYFEEGIYEIKRKKMMDNDNLDVNEEPDKRDKLSQIEFMNGNGFNKNESNKKVDKENKNKMYYLCYSDKNRKFSKEEKIFLKFFKSSSKFGSFFQNFIELDDICELYLIPFMFIEEFLNLKRTNDPNINALHYFDIIDNFNPQYPQKKLSISLNANILDETQMVNIGDLFVESVDFRNFYSHFYTTMKDQLFEDSSYYSHITPIQTRTFNFITKSYKYNSIELNPNLIQIYAYYLSTIPYEKLIQIFPSIEIQKENEIQMEHTIAIPNTIERTLIEKKIISTTDLIVYSILNIIGVYIELIQCCKEIEDVEELLREVKFGRRKYLAMLTSILYRITEKKFHDGIKNNNNDISNELLYFEILFDTLRTTNEIPTIQLNRIATNFNKLKNEFTPSNHNSNINNNNNNKLEINEDTKTQQTYRSLLLLQNTECQCEDTNKHNDTFFYTLSKNVRINKTISFTCNECDIPINPTLSYHSFISELYSPSKIYEQSSSILSTYETTLSNSSFSSNIIQTLLLNLIYYSSIIPNFKYSTCSILIKIFNTFPNI